MIFSVILLGLSKASFYFFIYFDLSFRFTAIVYSKFILALTTA